MLSQHTYQVTGIILSFYRDFQVLSHSLCTVMKIPHDPVALEEHFRDDDEGPVSNQGYMPYLNRFILDKVSFLHPLLVVFLLKV